MPRFDGTGPEGKGSRTGRGQGKCGSGQKTDQATEAGTPASAPLGQGRGRGAGAGRGQGAGAGRRNAPLMSR